MNDALDMVKATFEGIVGQVVGNLAPVVESLANDFLAFVEEWNNIGGEGGTIADTISNALLDVADYFAGVFDNAMAGFDGFGVTLSEVGAVFEFVGNIFTAVSETIRAGFNLFQISGNVLAMGLGKFLEGIGSWVSSDLEKFGKDLTANAKAQADQNSREMEGAASNAATAAGRAIFGGNAAQGGEGPASRAVANARNRMNDPEAKAERERERAQKEADAKAAREAAAAKAKAEKDAADAKKRQDEAAKKAADIDEKMVDKQGQIAEIEAGKSAALNGKSNEALKANDIRSSEGMAQFIALATGREDPAIEENRKTNMKLEEIRNELRALQQEKVDILGAAA
jgi:flagellar biosynthesis GTPase FlhF